MIKKAIDIKKTEYANFETLKTAYNTKKTAFEASMKTRALNFAKFNRGEALNTAELESLKSIPQRPDKPEQPPAYGGPTVDNVNLFSQYAGSHGGWGMPTITEMTDKESIWAGKSFGVLGQGLTTGVKKATASDYAIDLGVTPNEKATDGTTCLPHYMILTVAPKLSTDKTYDISFKAGAKAFKTVITD